MAFNCVVIVIPAQLCPDYVFVKLRDITVSASAKSIFAFYGSGVQAKIAGPKAGFILSEMVC